MPASGRPGAPGTDSASGAAGSTAAGGSTVGSGGLEAYGDRSNSGGLNRIPPASTAGTGAGGQSQGQGGASQGTTGQGSAGQSGTGQGSSGQASAGQGSAGSAAGGGAGVMTASQRVAVLDGELGGAYGDFDGLILAERSRAQRRANEVGDDPAGLYDEDSGQGSGGDGGSGSLPGVTGVQTAGVSGVSGFPGGDGRGPQAGGSGGSVGGVNGGPAGEQRETFPVPDDIPPGGGDDVVARQIREAALREPDPELREALWDEYRRYTGLEITGAK